MRTPLPLIRTLFSRVALAGAGRSGVRAKSATARKATPRRRHAPQRSSSRPSQRTPGATRRRTAGERSRFHTPSFSAGIIVGALVILIAAYVPEFLSNPTRSGSAPSGQGVGETALEHPPAPEVTFEFDNLLRNSQVTADPDAYQMQGQSEEPGSIEYLIQAASFRHEEEADALRAQLLLQDLPASTTSTRLDNAVWYRVTVGPFDSQVLAQRALTQLREQNLDALYIRRRKPT